MFNTSINQLDLEYLLESKIIIALRAIFKHDDDFTYTENELDSRIIIASSFPEKDADFKIPQIVVSVQNISMSSATSLFDNYESDIYNSSGQVIGSKFSTIVPYNISIICIANNDSLSKDLSNKVFKYIIFTKSEIFNGQQRLGIQNISKSQGGQYRQMPDKAYAHNVALSGTLHWSGTKTFSPDDMIILNKIRLDIIQSN